MLLASQLAADAARATRCDGGHHVHRDLPVWLCCLNHLHGCPLQPGIERRYTRQESRNSQFSGNSGTVDSSVHGTSDARRSAELHGSELLLDGLHRPSAWAVGHMI